MSQFKQLKCEIKCFHTLLDSLQEKDKNSLLLILRSEMSEEDWSKFGGEWGMGNGHFRNEIKVTTVSWKTSGPLIRKRLPIQRQKNEQMFSADMRLCYLDWLTDMTQRQVAGHLETIKSLSGF